MSLVLHIIETAFIGVRVRACRSLPAAGPGKNVCVGTDASSTAHTGDVITVADQDLGGSWPRGDSLSIAGLRRGCCQGGGCLLIGAEAKMGWPAARCSVFIRVRERECATSPGVCCAGKKAWQVGDWQVGAGDVVLSATVNEYHCEGTGLRFAKIDYERSLTSDTDALGIP